MIYLDAIRKLVEIRQPTHSKNAADEALVLELLDRTWEQLSYNEKKVARWRFDRRTETDGNDPRRLTMGMYDTVRVPCPQCGERAEFQSKGGDCKLETYTLEDAPDDVLLDANRHSPMRCEKCGALFGIEIGGLPERKIRTLTARPVVWRGKSD
jgi:predicted RNA-binding Zn-ribbon protein involved in translation (DUF1610 family)